MLSIAKRLILAIEFTTARRITSAAAALTYSTLLAFVPILAVVFAIARGFGYNKYIEEWFRIPSQASLKLLKQLSASSTRILYIQKVVVLGSRSYLHVLHGDYAYQQY